MDADTDIGPDDHPRDLFALAACEPLRGQEGCYVAPDIPDKVLATAMGGYLRLRPGELLLAVVDPSAGKLPTGGCALTTRRICWFGKANRDDPGAAGHEAGEVDALGSRVARRGESLDYGELPEAVTVKGILAKRLLLGEGKQPQTRLGGPAIGALTGVLATLRGVALADDLAGSVAPEAVGRARAALADVVRKTGQVHRIVGEIRSFHALARAATPRVVVSRAFVAACVLAYLAMVLSGVAPMDPSPKDLIDWGGNLGAAVALDGEGWRLLTSMFLHGGLIHLALNMWCLWQAGPLVERLYGNVGFALLYLASGLGGSLAGARVHPMVVGVGASGAIFGIFGGLLAFLLTHRAAIPASVLRPIRASAIGFVIYNGVFGLVYPGIDNAAHLGGLATGFVAGLLLRRPWPVPRPTAGLVRQLAGGAALAAGLAFAGVAINASIRDVPEVLAIQRLLQMRNAYNALMGPLNPIVDRFDATNARLDELLGRLEQTAVDDPGPRRTLDGLIADVEADRASLEGVTAHVPDLVAIRAAFAEGQDSLLLAMRALRQYLDDPADQALIGGPQGFVTLRQRCNQQIGRFIELNKAYATKYGPRAEGAVPAPRDHPGR